MNRHTTVRTSRKALSIGLVGVVVIAVLAYLLIRRADLMLERALELSYRDVERVRGSARFEWDGDVVASKLVIYPTSGDESRAIRFERIHLETPGWIWFVRNIGDPGLDSASLERMRLTLEGGRSGAGIDLSLGQLGPVGAASASPFDTEGCLEDATWSHEALNAMGLRPGATTLAFDFRIEGTDLFTTIGVETRNAARVQLDRRSQIEAGTGVLQIDRKPYVTHSERWHAIDSGFVVARNRYCAKKDGIDGRTFLERHVDSVERLLATRGLVLDNESRLAYRRFARDGGSLVFGGTYAPPLDSDSMLAERAAGNAFRRMAATIEQGGRTVPLRWSQVVARPLRSAVDELTTFAVLQRERNTSANSDDDEAETSVSTDEVKPADSGSVSEEATAAPPTASVPPTPSVSEEAAVATEADPGGPGSENQAESEPVASPASAPAATTPPPAVAVSRPSRLDWEDLAPYEGRLIRVWTVHNPPRTVQLVEYSPTQLRVTARLGGGHAEYTIQREGYIRALLVR